MASSHDSANMAVFCDFENVALGVRDAKYEKFDIKPVLERLLLKGSIVVKKAYCDWDRYKAFKAAMHEANFELIEIPHVRQSGKNSADIRLVVDALDLCYTKAHVDTFVIVSGDSDFSPLVSKLRENAKRVIGVGVKRSTSDLLIANCDEFIFYDDLVRTTQASSERRQSRAMPGSERKSDAAERPGKDDLESRRQQAIELAVDTYEALIAERGDSGKIWASALKDAIKRRRPDFNESYYGFRAFGSLLETAQRRGLLDVGRDEKSGTYVYRQELADDDALDAAEPGAQGTGAETKRTTPARHAPTQVTSHGHSVADVNPDIAAVSPASAPAAESSLKAEEKRSGHHKQARKVAAKATNSTQRPTGASKAQKSAVQDTGTGAAAEQVGADVRNAADQSGAAAQPSAGRLTEESSSDAKPPADPEKARQGETAVEAAPAAPVTGNGTQPTASASKGKAPRKQTRRKPASQVNASPDEPTKPQSEPDTIAPTPVSSRSRAVDTAAAAQEPNQQEISRSAKAAAKKSTARKSARKTSVN